MQKIQKNHDAFGAFLTELYTHGNVFEIVERDDGYIEASPHFTKTYLSPFKDWSAHERSGVQLAKGPALDIGAGAGRTTLYLQKKSIETLAIDNSPLAVKVMKERGVKHVRIMSIEELTKLPKGHFRSILMMGNNFGLFGSARHMPGILRAMARITTPDARIIAECRNPYDTKTPEHLAYHRRNRARGRMGGHIRLRVRYANIIGPWLDYLFASPAEILNLLKGTRWEVERFLKNKGPQFVVVMRKRVIQI